MSSLRVGWRSRIDKLWQDRAEKQRRLGLGVGEPTTPPRLNLNDSFSCAASEAGSIASNDTAGERTTESAAGMEDGGDGADRVGTLLVRMGQLDGVGGVGLLSLAPKAVATLMLEESSATLEEMDLETNVTEVCVLSVAGCYVPSLPGPSDVDHIFLLCWNLVCFSCRVPQGNLTSLLLLLVLSVYVLYS